MPAVNMLSLRLHACRKHVIAAMLLAIIDARPSCSGSCCCSGAIGAGDPLERSDYGTFCYKWDAPDEEPWCVVDRGACGDADTFASDANYWWSHAPCNGKSLTRTPEALPSAAAVVGAAFWAGAREFCRMQAVAKLPPGTKTCAARPDPAKGELPCLEPWRPHSAERCLHFLDNALRPSTSASASVSQRPPPCDDLVFHTFWLHGDLRDSEWLFIRSFVSTQPRCAKLIVWIGELAALTSARAASQHECQPRKDAAEPSVEYRLMDVPNVVQLARGSPVEHYTEDQLRAILHQPRQGLAQWINLVKLLLLLRYGGVWVDFDVVLLRDFAPLLALRTSFMESWSAESFVNNAIVHFARDNVGRRMLLLMLRDGKRSWEMYHSKRKLTADIFLLPWGGYEMTRACALAGAWCRAHLRVLPNEAVDALWPTVDHAPETGAVLNMSSFGDFTSVAQDFAYSSATGTFDANAATRAFFPGAFAFHHHSGYFKHPPKRNSFAHAFQQHFRRKGYCAAGPGGALGK